MPYTTSDVRTLFSVAPETVRNWTREFARYLSPTANPETGRTRLFTEDDMRVLDQVSKMRADNRTYEEIHVALGAGQRGSIPGMSPEDVRALVTGEAEKRLSLEIQFLRRQLASAEEKLAELEAMKARNIRLEAEKEAEQRRALELQNQLKALQDKQESLLREIGQSYHQGYMAALNQTRKPD